VYVLYDHHRRALWGADQKGYCFRKTAGQYTREEAAKVLQGSSRFFTAEEVPVEIQQALVQQGAMA